MFVTSPHDFPLKFLASKGRVEKRRRRRPLEPARDSRGRDRPTTLEAAARSSEGDCGGTLGRRSAHLPPGRHTPFDMVRRGQPRVLRGLHCHRGAFAEGAVEDHRLTAQRKCVDEAAIADVVRELGVRRMQRAGNGALPLPFAPLDRSAPRPAARPGPSPPPRTKPSRAARPPPDAGPDACWRGPRHPSSSDWAD